MKRLAFILMLMVSAGFLFLPGSALALSFSDPGGDVDPDKPPLDVLGGFGTVEEFAAIFDPTQVVENPYFPMTDTTTTRVYESDDGEESFELTNIGLGRVIMGVQTSTQLDRAFEDGLLVEETFDYYAQDIYGRVWYMGEDVTNYEYDDDGNLVDINNESAWIADGEDALPGWIMLDDPNDKLGFNHYQEIAAEDEALDEGTIWALIDEVVLGNGDVFNDVLQVLEFDPFDEEYGYKYYAPYFGLIKEEENLVALGSGEFGDPELTIEYVASVAVAVPEPGTVILLGAGLLGLAGLGRRKIRT